MTGQADFQSRLKFADKEKLALTVLEMALALGFSKAPGVLRSPSAVLSEAMNNLRALLPWEAAAFYLADGETFRMTLCQPISASDVIARQVRELMNDGIMALCVREEKPVTAYDKENGQRLIFGPVMCSPRLKGVFIGSLQSTGTPPDAIMLSLVKLVLRRCAEELERTEKMQSLQSRNLNLQSLFDSVPVLSINSDGIISYCSACAARQLGVLRFRGNDNDKKLSDYLNLPDENTWLISPMNTLEVTAKNSGEKLLLHVSPMPGELFACVLLPASQS